MTRPLAVLRPDPGNAVTAARIEAEGLRAIRLPLFAVMAVAWKAPDPARYDALLLTSANAIRHGGAELDRLRALPVVAVGDATAAAARDAGFEVREVGTGGVEAIVARSIGVRLLHLAGRDHRDAGVDAITVYASDPLAVDPTPLLDSVALVHSARAGARLAEIAPDRSRISIAAISRAAADAAGAGWAAAAAADMPTDAALIAAARTLCD
ncbi:uroporphyrinogen-III synthase [Sphingomonas sp. DT-204]|uniref:uroporphyrinogen-III synthase n=1 Tax=Sphingomonas sp. DT-204 TaxID=3396166 RepID=UPI003F1E0745